MHMVGQKTSTAAAVVVVMAAIGVDVLLSACGGGGPTAPTPVPVVFGVTISSSGLSLTDLVAPSEAESNSPTRPPDEVFIRFTNIDSVAHDIRSDPHPAHTNCPALNVETVGPGQSVLTPVLNQCLAGTTQQSYHDETRPDDARFLGRIGRRR